MSLTYGRMRMYPGKMYPLIKPSATRHYYTTWASHVEEYMCSQGRSTLPTNSAKCYSRSAWHVEQCRHTTTMVGQLDMLQNADIPNRKSYIFCSCLQSTFIMQDQGSRQSPQKHRSWFNRQVMQITYAALYKHLALLFSDSSQLCIYITSPHILAPNVCMQMLSGLFPINTNSLISFHEQYSVLLHLGTTFKELLSLVFYREIVHSYIRSPWHLHSSIRLAQHLRMQIHIL